MSESEIIINIEALTELSKSMQEFVTAYKEAITTAIRDIQSVENSWNDEDYNKLMGAIKTFLLDIDTMESGTKQLIERINNKISAVHELHNMTL